MKLPLRWLKEYVEYNVTHEEFAQRLLWRGFEVASIEDELPGVSGVVAGRVQSMEDHPDAKKLHVCTVDAGTGTGLTIVCGAPNVAPGIVVPVALPGATLPGGATIEVTALRGVESHGMLCSGEELGIHPAFYPGADADGLLLLPQGTALGTPIQQAVGMDGVIFDIDLTPNRADCQSIIGMCREAAAALGQPFVEPEIPPVQGSGRAEDFARVTVENPDLCPRYCARVVTDLRVGPSPLWLQRKLLCAGLRPINNIVDITNLVLVEYGHPMHAFDLSCIAQGHVVVRNATAGETVTTLDSKVRPVTPDMLLIADPDKGVGIAGVMGGENSEITATTQATLFESAVFQAANIRETSRKLRHVTDSAARFSRGVEPVNAKKALDRAIQLVQELGAGTVIGNTIDVCNVDVSPRVIRVDARKVNAILNLDLPAAEMARLLGTINLETQAQGDALVIRVPHHRTDIDSGLEGPWNIAEEVGRLYGYDNIAPTLMQGDTFLGRLSEPFADEDRLKDEMAAQGAYEAYNYNFIGPATLDALRLPENSFLRQAVRLMNPFGEDQSLMRTTLIPGLCATLSTNLNRRTGHGRFFEVGNVHFDNNPDLPEERKKLGIAFVGPGEDFFTLKGTIEELLASFGIRGAQYLPGGGEYLHPGRCAVVLVAGEEIGEMGELHPLTARALDVSARAYVAELDVARLLSHKAMDKRYAPLPRFPVVARDLALVVEEGVRAADMQAAIAAAPTGVLVEDVRLFDVFRGEAIGPGKKSMAYSFTLRARDRTLNEEDITAAVGEILHSLKTRFGAALRS